LIPSIMRKKVKFVYTLNDYFIACPNGGFFNYTKNTICDLKPLSWGCLWQNCDARNYYHKLWRILRHWIQKRLGKIPTSIHHFITVSDFSARILTPYLPSGSTCFRVPNLIGSHYDRPVNVEKNTIFMYIGRLSQEKGCHIFAAAAREMKLKTTFIGDGYRKNDILKCYPEAVVTGWLTQAEINRQLDQARALIFPSLWYETQGMTVLEAASRGIPSIVSDTCAATEFVEHGVNGLHFTTGSIEDLIEKIQILQDNETVKKLGENAYQKFWSNPPTMEGHLEKLIEIYNTI
jgi:glycosyltransferase involved in cell wall biosynthesis